MTYVRVGKQVLEFNGRNNRKNYDNAKSDQETAIPASTQSVEKCQAPSLLLKVIDRLLQPVARSIVKYDTNREQGYFDSSGLSFASTFGKDGYCLSISAFLGRSSWVIHLVNMGNGPAFKVVRYDDKNKK